MRLSDQSISQLFDRTRQYVVPLFQRRYVWNQGDQWEPLWQDILDRTEAILNQKEDTHQRDEINNHFLGAIVLNPMKAYELEIESAEIIDGQQRLTTIQLILAAFRDIVQNNVQEKDRNLVDILQRLTKNNGVEREEEQFKVWPTNADRQDFSASVSSGSVQKLEERYPLIKEKYKRKPNPRPDLIEAYLYFSQAIQDFCFPVDASTDNLDSVTELSSEFSTKNAFALIKALRQHLRLVVIELEDGDDPQVIFETLNARGVPLLPSDLIRNFIFLRATRQRENPDVLYSKWWAEYDNEFWKQGERQGRILHTRLDLFIYHYIKYQSGRDMGIGHLYGEFRDWWEKEGDRRVDQELQELRRHSDVFATFFDPKGEERIDTFFTRLRILDTTTLYPVLLMLFVGGQARVVENDLEGIITDLESYLVRRMVCDLGTKNYNRFFLSMLQHLRDEKSITRSLVQSILLAPDGSAGEWPDDKKFVKAWMEEPIYENITAPRCKMILSAIDHTMRSNKQESIIVDDLTIEHVLPQSWKPSGHDDSDEDANGLLFDLLHSFGNLTLLTQPLNSSVGNNLYKDKRPEITKQSALRLNTYFQDMPTWNEEEIRKRGRFLYEHARKIWPHPEDEQ